MKLGRKGMVGFPVKLAVAFLILSVSIPAVTGMAGNLTDGNAVDSATAEAGKVVSAISKVYYSGIGSMQTVELSISSKSHLKIGGEGSHAYSVGIFLEDAEKNRLVLQRPSVKILGEGLEVSGNVLLSVKCVQAGKGCGVEVGIVD